MEKYIIFLLLLFVKKIITFVSISFIKWGEQVILKRAFTIIELMITIAVIGLLSAIALPKISEINSKAKVANVQGNLANLRTSIGIYMAKTGEYPDLENNENLEDIIFDTYKFTDFYSRSVMPYTPSSEDTDKINSVVTTRSNIGGWLYLYDTGDIYANLEDGNYTGDEVNEVWEEEGSTDTSDDTSDDTSTDTTETSGEDDTDITSDGVSTADIISDLLGISSEYVTEDTESDYIKSLGNSGNVRFDSSIEGYYILSNDSLSNYVSLSSSSSMVVKDIATTGTTIIVVSTDSSGNTVYYYVTL